MPVKCDIIISTHSNYPWIQTCIEFIRKCTPQGFYNMVIVDDRSGDATPDFLKSQPDVQYIRNNLHDSLAYNWNLGILASHAPYLAIMNDDCIVSPGWLETLVAHLEEPGNGDVGAVGPMTFESVPGVDQELAKWLPVVGGRDHQSLTSRDHIVNNLEHLYYGHHTGRNHPEGRGYFDFCKMFQERNEKYIWEHISTYLFCMRRDTIAHVGLFNTCFRHFYFEDLEFFQRLRFHGFKMRSIGKVFVSHLRGTSVIREDDYTGKMEKNHYKFDRLCACLSDLNEIDGKPKITDYMNI